MAEINLSRLVIAVFDEVNLIARQQELLRICQEELDNPDHNSQTRVQLLLGSYLTEVEYHFDELNSHLNKLQRVLHELRQLVTPPPH